MKGCIFDLDGVIVDTAKYHYLAWKEIASELGFEFTEKDNELLKGVSRMASLEILLNIGGINVCEEEKLKLADKKNKIYLSYITKMTSEEVLPGVRDFLEALHQNGIQIALGSASKNAKTILKQVGIEDMFDAIADGTNVTQAKPDPEVFQKGSRVIAFTGGRVPCFRRCCSGSGSGTSGGNEMCGSRQKRNIEAGGCGHGRF